jgi:hypothetical protein
VENSKQDGNIPLIDNRGVGPLSRALPPCTLWQRLSSTSQLSQISQKLRAHLYLRIKERLSHPRCPNRTTVDKHVKVSKEGRDVPRLSK